MSQVGPKSFLLPGLAKVETSITRLPWDSRINLFPKGFRHGGSISLSSLVRDAKDDGRTVHFDFRDCSRNRSVGWVDRRLNWATPTEQLFRCDLRFMRSVTETRHQAGRLVGLEKWLRNMA